MALVSMATPDDSNMPCDVTPNPYGYGLRIQLNDDQCEALGITSIITPGTTVMLTARAVVQSATETVESDGDDTGNDIYLELQITDMELNSGATTDKNASDTLYPEKSAAKAYVPPGPSAQVVNPSQITRLG